MDRAPAQAADDAVVAEHDAFHGTVIRQHRDDDFAPAGVGHVSGGAGTMLDQRTLFAGVRL